MVTSLILFLLFVINNSPFAVIFVISLLKWVIVFEISKVLRNKIIKKINNLFDVLYLFFMTVLTRLILFKVCLSQMLFTVICSGEIPVIGINHPCNIRSTSY